MKFTSEEWENMTSHERLEHSKQMAKEEVAKNLDNPEFQEKVKDIVSKIEPIVQRSHGHLKMPSMDLINELCAFHGSAVGYELIGIYEDQLKIIENAFENANKI